MKTPLLSFFLMMMTAIALGQHKPPVAVTDYASTQAGVPVMIPILANDYCMLGHTIELFFAGQPENGTCEVMDSIIIYTPWAYFSGDDSITYIIKDVTSSLFSESGKVYINVKNDGFNWLDINNWHARINVFGNHFWDFYSASSSSSIPAASGCGTIFNSSLWIGGYDEQGGLHLAAERYRLDFLGRIVADFFPGPVMDNQHYCFEQDTLWNRVWKINRTEIDNHINNWWKSNYQPLKEIAEWPGNGDTLLGQAAQLAPFFDRNHDGKYIPKDGDYPLIKGDQAIYFIFNDDRNIHTASGGNKLGIEIHGLAYAFNCEAQAELYNTFFIDYKIFNRSTGTYYDTYLGIFTDFDLGWGQDDHLASDVPTSSLIVYNGDPEDGFDNPGSYGLHPPAQSVSLLSGPLMDADGFDNTASGPDGSPLCNEGINGEGFGDGIIDNEKYGMTGSMAFPPFYWFYFYQNPEEIYNHFLGLWRDGSSMLYGGTGMYEENAYGPSCRFIFPGISDSLFWGTGCNPPNGPANWTMQTAGIEPGDVSGMISSGPWTFFPGESVEISLAYIYARQDDPSINQTSLELLINDIQKVKSAYRNESLQCGPGPSNLNKHYSATPNIRLYPNPTEDKVHIILPPKTNQAHYQLFTAMGNLVENDKIIGNEATIDLTKQKSGFYTIQIQTTSQTWISKIIKI